MLKESSVGNGAGKATQKFVYAAWQQNTNLCKIGCSNNPNRRVQTFRTGNPYEVVLLGCVPSQNGYADERRVRQLLGNNFTREWHKSTPAKVMAALNAVAQI